MHHLLTVQHIRYSPGARFLLSYPLTELTTTFPGYHCLFLRTTCWLHCGVSCFLFAHAYQVVSPTFHAFRLRAITYHSVWHLRINSVYNSEKTHCPLSIHYVSLYSKSSHITSLYINFDLVLLFSYSSCNREMYLLCYVHQRISSTLGVGNASLPRLRHLSCSCMYC